MVAPAGRAPARTQAGAALAAGCPMIVKPAEATPLTALALAQLGAEALQLVQYMAVIFCVVENFRRITNLPAFDGSGTGTFKRMIDAIEI